MENREWKSVVLGKKAEINRGGSPRPIDDFITDNPAGINWIKIGDVNKSAKYIDSTSEKIKPEGSLHSRKVKIGDFILSNSMSFGRPYILKIDGCIHDGWLAIQNYQETFNTDFLYYLLGCDSTLTQYRSMAAGSTVLNLNKEIVSKVVVTIPNLATQNQIAQILSNCDSVISQTQSAITKYRAIKQGLLHDLFTRGLDATGRLRPTCREAPELYKASELGMIPREWDVKRLGKIFSVSSGNGLTQNNIQLGTCPVYGGNGINGYHNEYLFENEKLIIGRVGEYCGNAFITKPRSWVTDNALITTFYNSNFNLIFWFYYLNFLKLNNFAYAAAQPVITGNLLNKVNSLIIGTKEQGEIVQRLSSLDNKLQSEETLLQKYQSIKRGLMEDLLGGGRIAVETRCIVSLPQSPPQSPPPPI